MDIERFLEVVTREKGRVAAVVDTHIHADHLSGAREIQQLTSCSLIMHESSPAKFSFTPIKEGEHELAGLTVRVIHTPGHAPEHMCLLIENRVLLSGDCLLVRDVGRIDLGRGDPYRLYDSIFSKLLALNDDVEVLPGHVGVKHFVSGDTSSTIGIERRANPALQTRSKEEFMKYMQEGWPRKPDQHELFVKVNSGELRLGQAQDLAKAKQGELVSQ